MKLSEGGEGLVEAPSISQALEPIPYGAFRGFLPPVPVAEVHLSF